MKNIFLILFVCNSAFFSAQKKKSYQQTIDSIAHQQWKQSQLNIDSLSNPKVVPLEIKLKDTIFIKEEHNTTKTLNYEVPITPFALNNYESTHKWHFFGQNNLLINQASFSNWNSGGNNSFGINGKINYNLSYKYRRHYFENIIQLGYGWMSSKGQTSRKTDDNINLMFNYGYDLSKNFYLSTGIQFLSQFSPGYNYALTPNPTYEDRISKFLAPGYLNIGLGASYNPNEKLQIIFRPINGKFTFVSDPKLQKAGRYGLEKDGQSIKTELGAMLHFIYRLDIYKGIYLDNQLGLFSNYLSHSERMDVSYNGVLNIKFNKLITTTVSVDLLYDHDQIQALQHKQTLAIGFIYNIGIQNKEKQGKANIFKAFNSK